MARHPNPGARRAYSLALAALLLVAARRPPRPEGELVLDAAGPVVDVHLSGIAARLRVDPGQWGAIELNPEAAARLPVAFEDGNDAMVGRAKLVGRAAHALLGIAGKRPVPVAVAEHGRTVVADADGLIGPDILPYASIRWQNHAAPRPRARLSFALDYDEDTGLGAIDPAVPGALRVHFSFVLPFSFATGAAGSDLARDHGGRFVGSAAPIPAPFGLTRPARLLVFASPPMLAGFRFGSVQVRIGDFRGHNPLPADAMPAASDVVVARREEPQQAEPWVTIAADRLARCAELTYSAEPRTITLACAFQESAR